MLAATPIQIQTPKKARLLFPDALRGYAILMVLLVHVGQRAAEPSWFQDFSRFGQLGVQLFFVVSAFTLSFSVDGKNDGRLSFLIRRWFRIAPMYYLGIIGYFLFAWGVERVAHLNAFYAPVSLYTPENVVLNFLFLHGFSVSAINGIVPGGWSIGAEFFFYLVFACLFLKNRSIPVLGTCIIVYTTLLMAFFVFGGDLVWNKDYNNRFPYFMPLTQFPCFLMGILAYQVYRHKPLPAWLLSSGILIPWVFIISLWKYQSSPVFLLVPTLAGISFSCLLLATARFNHAPSWAVVIGERSYSMYLNHFVLIIFTGRIISQKLSFLGTVFPAVAAFIVTGIVSYLIAGITYKWIEIPFVKQGKKLSDKIRQLRKETSKTEFSET